ncbi:hypothetical protein MHH94_09910 [Mammaliicoccus sp. FSL K6-3158]|uniref:hypothetical protein n=1 Tax=Mammaliicoccus sp. FSL K6-3158 TaxID=2921491 RepID=UPI0030F503E7
MKNIMNEIFIETSPNIYLLKRIKELIWSIEALISLLLSTITIFIMYYFFQLDSILYKSVISDLILTFIGGLITMIAFSLSALALVLSIFKTEDIERISKVGIEELSNSNKKLIFSKVEIFAILIYRFYASGILNLISIFLLIIGYFIVNLPITYSNFVLYPLTLVSVYIVYFSLIFTVLLIPTCIKFKFIEYIDTNDKKQDPISSDDSVDNQ